MGARGERVGATLKRSFPAPRHALTGPVPRPRPGSFVIIREPQDETYRLSASARGQLVLLLADFGESAGTGSGDPPPRWAGSRESLRPDLSSPIPRGRARRMGLPRASAGRGPRRRPRPRRSDDAAAASAPRTRTGCRP